MISMEESRCNYALRMLLYLAIIMVARSSENGTNSRPVMEPPIEMMEAYTRDGQIPMEYFYVDDTINGEGTHFRFSRDQINKMVIEAKKLFDKIKAGTNHMQSRGISREAMLMKLRKEDWLYFALLDYESTLKDKRVAVIGSISPWVETLCLALGVGSVTTVEYNKLTYGGEVEEGENEAAYHITTISADEFKPFYAAEKGQFDFVFSMSSLDHDGLGRYGDPLNPDGDIEAMGRIRSLLKPGGLMFVTVPVGPDVVVFNLHRRYGPVRLPLLLEGWEVEHRIGWKEEALKQPANWRQTFEPVLVLKKPLSEGMNQDL